MVDFIAVLLLSSCAERGDTEEQPALREEHTNWREGSQTGRVICPAGQTARGEATCNRPPVHSTLRERSA